MGCNHRGPGSNPQ